MLIGRRCIYFLFHRLPLIRQFLTKMYLTSTGTWTVVYRKEKYIKDTFYFSAYMLNSLCNVCYRTLVVILSLMIGSSSFLRWINQSHVVATSAYRPAPYFTSIAPGCTLQAQARGRYRYHRYRQEGR
jgi:hypothetical protein